jgi:hypothetical protein
MVGCGLAAAQEGSALPGYFEESWKAVAKQPLKVFQGSEDETGAIATTEKVSTEVPAPPERPADAQDIDAKAQPIRAGSFTLKVPQNVRIKDRQSFAIGGDFYRLASTKGLSVSQECVPQPKGGCMRRPMRALKQAIAGRTLQCRHLGDGFRVECTR